jgi:hypothetical protein
MALAVVGQRCDLVPGLVLVAPGELGRKLAVAISLPVIEIAQHERRAGDAERRVGRRNEADADVDDIDGAEPKPVIELVLVAELGSRKHLDVVFAVGALPDFAGRPQRLGVVGFGYLVDMRPFQLGLCRNRVTYSQGNDDAARQRKTAHPNGHVPSELTAEDLLAGLPAKARRNDRRMQAGWRRDKFNLSRGSF